MSNDIIQSSKELINDYGSGKINKAQFERSSEQLRQQVEASGSSTDSFDMMHWTVERP